jgi:hypothetical protein
VRPFRWARTQRRPRGRVWARMHPLQQRRALAASSPRRVSATDVFPARSWAVDFPGELVVVGGREWRCAPTWFTRLLREEGVSLWQVVSSADRWRPIYLPLVVVPYLYQTRTEDVSTGRSKQTNLDNFRHRNRSPSVPIKSMRRRLT